MKLKNTMLRSGLIYIMMVICAFQTQAQTKGNLRFKPDKTFKIAQFTDIHWDDSAQSSKESEATIKMVVETEKPGLILLTGDIVTYSPAANGWKSISKIMQETGIPWAVVLGNHDDETDLTREAIFKLLEPMPGFIGEAGPKNISGVGNYVLTIKSATSEKPKALIYCFDSHAYPKSYKLGSYDWIKYDQLGWYRAKSADFTGKNARKPLPALAYFHIPLPEIEKAFESKGATGYKNESNGSSDINSGLLASIIEMKDVMGVFSGHDHENNYIGMVNGIALGYGQVTGSNAYGSFDRGSRIVELHEDEFAFKTWIRTREGAILPFNYPFGYSSGIQEIYLPAVTVKSPKPGLKYNYYEAGIKSVNDMQALKPISKGIMPGISLKPKNADNGFGFEYTGFIKIPEKGLYSFYTFSDDGSALYIDGQLLVNNDGSHSAKREEATIALDEGFHSFRLLYFDDCMGETLEAGFSGIKIPETVLPTEMLYYEE